MPDQKQIHKTGHNKLQCKIEGVYKLQVCLSVRYEMKTYTVLIYISRILAVYEVLLCNEIVETKSNMKRTVMYCICMTPERVCVPE